MQKWLAAVVAFSLLLGCKKKPPNCVPTAVQTLHSDVLRHEGTPDKYSNYASLDSVDADCVTPEYATQKANEYLSMIGNRKDVYSVEFYGMCKKFYVGELGEDYEEMNEHYLFEVYLKDGEIDSMILKNLRFW